MKNRSGRRDGRRVNVEKLRCLAPADGLGRCSFGDMIGPLLLLRLRVPISPYLDALLEQPLDARDHLEGLRGVEAGDRFENGQLVMPRHRHVTYSAC
jgi:hypothetical protein